MANHLGQAIRIPDYLADSSLNYYADLFRAMLDHFGTPGKRDSSSLQVRPASGGGMNIEVTPGTALVAGTDRTNADTTSGLTTQGSYVVRVDSVVGPVPVSAASSARIDLVMLVVSDKTEQVSGLNEAYIQVYKPTDTLPKSGLILARIKIDSGMSSVPLANILFNTQYLSGSPALTDPNYGYIDKKTDGASEVVVQAAALAHQTVPQHAPKWFSKLAVGGVPYALGTNISAGVLPTGGQSIPNATWTALSFNNSSASQYIDYRTANIIDDGLVIHAAGWIPLDVGWYRVSACVAMPTSTAGTNRGLRAVSAGGRVIACAVGDPALLSDNNPLSISQTFYWKYANATTDPILIQVYHNCGSAQRIGGQYVDGNQPQTAVLERLT